MTLINGRFYIDGKEVPVQIGNKEQIKLLKDRQKLMEEGAKIDIDSGEITTYTISATFQCPSCGRKNYIDDESEYEFDDSDIEDMLELDSACRGCGQDFELEVKNGNYRFKML
jgi:hypothetical protein